MQPEPWKPGLLPLGVRAVQGHRVGGGGAWLCPEMGGGLRPRDRTAQRPAPSAQLSAGVPGHPKEPVNEADLSVTLCLFGTTCSLVRMSP